jgi:putative SOS response-associated peptidase YedK
MIIIGQVSGSEILEAHFECAFKEGQEANKQYYIGQDGMAIAITSHNAHSFSALNYGMVPFFSKERIMHYEGPIEGSGHPSGEPGNIKKKVIQHPSFRKPIRESRCLIPADYFLTESDGGGAHLLFSLKSKPFALAGVFDSWKQSYQDANVYEGFSILTGPSTGKFKELGIERLPLIIAQNRYKQWLNKESHLTEITSLMHLTEEKDINGYPIAPNLFYDQSTDREIVRPVGELIFAIETTNYSKIAEFIKSFRYKKGVTHNLKGQEEKIWRGENK